MGRLEGWIHTKMKELLGFIITAWIIIVCFYIPLFLVVKYIIGPLIN